MIAHAVWLYFRFHLSFRDVQDLLAERLRTKGKRPKVIITAVMRKLLLLAWTLLRTGQPFSATHHVQFAGA